ncbi:hypothetical protein Hanom_Chr04g00285291 [Helianthus anomalus]
MSPVFIIRLKSLKSISRPEYPVTGKATSNNRTSQQMALSTAVLFPATRHYNGTLLTPSD